MFRNYYTVEELSARGIEVEPDTAFGASAILGLRRFSAPCTASAHVEIHREPKARQYASQYVGVTHVKGRWVGIWGARSEIQGPRRVDELEAAWDRARALGRDWLEVRG